MDSKSTRGSHEIQGNTLSPQSPLVGTAIFDRVRATDIGRIVFENLRRRRVYFLGIHRRSRLLDFAKGCGLIQKIRMETSSHIQYPAEGDRWPGIQLSQAGLPRQMSSKLVESIELLTGRTLSEQFCSALITKSLSSNLYEWGILNTWLRSAPNAPVVIYTSDPVAESIFSDSPENVHVKMRRTGALQVLKVISWTLRSRHLRRFLIRRMLANSNQTAETHEPSGELLLILNRSLSYGSLYSYDYLYDQIRSSPLHESKVRHLLLNPDTSSHVPAGSKFLADLYTRRFNRALTALVLFTHLKERRLSRVEQQILLVICHLVAQGVQVRDRLRELFPECTVAYLAFEFQVPAALNLALQLASIESVATVERPNMCYHEGSSIISDIYLVGDEAQGRAVQSIDASYVREYRVVGLWRTDFLFREIRSRDDVQYADPQRRKSILVLPFVILDSKDQVNDVFVTGSGFFHFMTEVAFAASRFPDVDFVIRGKNLQWLETEPGRRAVPLISGESNITIDRQFGEFGAAYRLAAQSDVVLAKYTSMVDECIYAGIPVAVHDYTQNASGRFRASNAYLPGDIFCQDRDQMLTQLDLYLKQTNEGLTGQRFVNSRFDGQVQPRIREQLTQEITTYKVSRA